MTFEKGLPSAEGNLTSEKAQEFSFKTYGAFKFVKSRCSYYNDDKAECEPSENWLLEFNNPIYPVALDKSQIKIEPNIEKSAISISDNYISIKGEKAARTNYKITIAPTLKDVFQQTLGSEISTIIKVGSERRRFFAQGDSLVTLDPQAKTEIFHLFAQSDEF